MLSTNLLVLNVIVAYIGKTDRTLLERVKEHAYKDQESAVNKHLNSCYDTLGSPLIDGIFLVQKMCIFFLCY